MFKKLTVNSKKLSGNYKSMDKEIETINTNQEKYNFWNNKKKTLEGITSRLDEAEDWITEQEDKWERNTQVEQLYEKRLKKYEHSLREWQDNIQIIGKNRRRRKEAR